MKEIKENWKQAMGPNEFRGLLSDSMEYPQDDIIPGKHALGCLKCHTITPLEPCSNCAHKGYHLNLNPDGIIGLFCTRCKQGMTAWDCNCGCTNPISYETILIKKRGGCFIVTAAYGNINSPELIYLSAFRDEVLNKSLFGQKFVHIYYAISPYLAVIILKSRALRSIIRALILKPIISLLRQFRCIF